MQIKIIAVGKIKEKYLTMGIEEYLKRIRTFAKIEVVEVPDESIPDRASPAEEEQLKQREGEQILKHIKGSPYIIALDLGGKMITSEKLSGLLQQLALDGRSEINVIIGGSLGLSPQVLARVDYRLSLSPMTFPHQLVRLIFLEQLYRSFKIWREEPYHK